MMRLRILDSGNELKEGRRYIVDDGQRTLPRGQIVRTLDVLDLDAIEFIETRNDSALVISDLGGVAVVETWVST